MMCLFGLFTVNAQETSFFYDFNDSSLEGWTVFQEEGSTSPNWAIGEGSKYGGKGDTPCVYSMSYDASSLVAKNYIVTSQAYTITAESVLSWYIKHTWMGYELNDDYAVVISTDGTNFEQIANYVGEIGVTKELSLANYADQTLYIGFYHYGQGGDAICIDDITLTAGETPEEPEQPEEPETPEEPGIPEDLYMVEVGADKNPDASASYYVPAYDYTKYAMSQQIYIAEELGGNVGEIYSLAFKLGNANEVKTRKYEVYLAPTELSAFDGNNFIALSEDNKVFDGEVEISGEKDSWYTINFDKPFNYTGGNFVLTVYDKTGEGLGNWRYHSYYKYSATGRSLYNYNSSQELDMLNLTTGTPATYVNQIQLGMSVDPVLSVSTETVALGDVKVGSYWDEEVKSANVEVQAISTAITSISCNNSFFTLNYDLTANPVVINVSYDKTAIVNGLQTATITVKAKDVEDATIAVSATAYTPAAADVYEFAQEIIFLGDAYTNTPAFANLHDDYNLPKEVNAGNTPDAVYSFELEDDATVTVNVTGTNAVAAIYNEDFEGEGGPKAKNNNKGVVEGVSGPTTFFYDFNDASLEAFNLIDADGDGYNWTTAKEYGTENHYAISYSIYGTKTPDNYMFTKDVYSITATSKLTYKVKSVKPYPDHYAIVVSEDGEDFEIVFEEDYAESTFSTKEVDLSVYAGKALYIGIRHYNCTDQYYVAIDDLQLTDGTVAARNVEPQVSAVYPAGKYYLVAAAEDAFTVNVVLTAAPTSAPKTLTATTVDETTIALAWEAVEEEVDGYNLYQDEELFTTVAADVTSYTVENLEPNTIYCYTMTAVKDNVESFKSNTVCAQTYDYIITAPTNAVVTALDAFSVEFTWDAVEHAQRYNIYIGGELVKSVTGTAYYLEDLTPATEYCFEVSAVRNDQETEKVLACGSTAAIDFNDENLATEFLFDFNDQILTADFMLLDADGDGNNWGASGTANGYGDTYAIRSYSYWYAPLTPDNYIYTKRPYRITEHSVVTLNAKCGTGMDSDLGEHYAVVVSEDGENWTVVFEETIEHADWTNTSVSLAEYAGKGVLVGIRHYNCSGFYFLAVDNFALTQMAPPAAPAVTATATSSTVITLTWDAVEDATSYNVYQGEVVLATVAETTYAVSGLEAETEYCFNVTAVNENGESVKSADACATTLAAGSDPINPEDEVPTAPIVKAEATSATTIVLTWPSVMTATSYKVYQGEEVLATVTETTYTVTGLEAETEYCFNVTAINENGESDKSADACAKTTGDAIAENVAALNIYPNPAYDRVVVETEATIESVSIYTITGVMIYSEVDFNDNTIDVSEFNGGVYIMKVRTENGEVVKRFVKK